MSSIVFSKKSAKYIKKLKDVNLKDIIQQEINSISSNPHENQLLTGRKYDGENIYKRVFSYNGVAYRIAYFIKEDKDEVGILLVGTRENFYKDLFNNLNMMII